MATVRAWPMWRLPVTLGGGQGMTNVPSGFGFPSGPMEGAKKPWAFHQSYHDDSTAMGLYPLAIGSVRSANYNQK